MQQTAQHPVVDALHPLLDALLQLRLWLLAGDGTFVQEVGLHRNPLNLEARNSLHCKCAQIR